MKTKLLILSIAVLCISAAPAMADFIAPTYSPTFGLGTPGEDSLQDVLDNITVDPTQVGKTLAEVGGAYDFSPNSSVNTGTDAVLDSWDSYWMIGGQGQSATTLVIEISAHSSQNAFGMYDAANSANMVTIFQGGAVAGAQAVVSIDTSGNVSLNYSPTGVTLGGGLFGFFLDTTTANQGIFYSDTGLNTDNFDHMLAYQGTGTDVIQIGNTLPGWWQTDTYALAWEDLLQGGDGDYQDFVVMVESITPVPVPAAVLLAILGLGVAGIKLRKFA